MAPGLRTPMTMKRIQREINDLKKEDLGSMVLEPTDNLQVWRGVIPGPEGSVYEGGVFQVEITLPNDYPFTSPKVVFKTRIYHMNISEQGGICIDILKNNWSPALSLFKVMLSLSSLLTDPNPKDPLVPLIASEYLHNRNRHDATARQWTLLHAKAPEPARPPQTPSGPSSAFGSRPNETLPELTGSSRQRLNPVAHLPAQATSSSSNADQVIVLDSDGERSSSSRQTKRKTRANHVNEDAAVFDLTESDKESEMSSHVGKKRKTRSDRDNGEMTSGPSSSSRPRRNPARRSDVIVIDD